jgi:hypothetical protein
MADYTHGKIYKLDIDNLVYIGSTFQTLTERFKKHKKSYNRWCKTGKNYMSSFELFKVGEPTIELIEDFPCGSKRELRLREGFHQKQITCVNKNIAGQTPEEYYQANQPRISERDKLYYQANRQNLAEQKKLYRVTNRQKINERVKLYYQANQQKIAERQKLYREANRQKLNEQKKKRILNIKRNKLLTLFIQTHIQLLGNS